MYYISLLYSVIPRLSCADWVYISFIIFPLFLTFDLPPEKAFLQRQSKGHAEAISGEEVKLGTRLGVYIFLGVVGVC